MFVFATSSNISSDGAHRLFCHVCSLQFCGVCKSNTHSGDGWQVPLTEVSMDFLELTQLFNSGTFQHFLLLPVGVQVLWFCHCSFFFFSFMSILVCMSYCSNSTERQVICVIQTKALFAVQDIAHLSVLLTLFQLWGALRFSLRCCTIENSKFLGANHLLSSYNAKQEKLLLSITLVFQCDGRIYRVINIHEMYKEFYSDLLQTNVENL